MNMYMMRSIKQLDGNTFVDSARQATTPNCLICVLLACCIRAHTQTHKRITHIHQVIEFDILQYTEK